MIAGTSSRTQVYLSYNGYNFDVILDIPRNYIYLFDVEMIRTTVFVINDSGFNIINQVSRKFNEISE